MPHLPRMLCTAGLALLAVSAPAGAAPFSGGGTALSGAEPIWQRVAWQCYWKRNCIKFDPGHPSACAHWGQRKVCSPGPFMPSAPETKPPKIRVPPIERPAR
jgi:hypothetical protein